VADGSQRRPATAEATAYERKLTIQVAREQVFDAIAISAAGVQSVRLCRPASGAGNSCTAREL
jgi:hypothetical protein